MDSDLLPYFTIHGAVIPTLKYELVNSSILTVVNYAGSRDGPNYS